MLRNFSTTARTLLLWLGLDINKVPPSHRNGVHKFLSPGGGGEMKCGKLKAVTIYDVNGVAVHQSHYNPEDKRWVVRAKLEGERETKMCHIFPNGEGTSCKGDTPE